MVDSSDLKTVKTIYIKAEHLVSHEWWSDFVTLT